MKILIEDYGTAVVHDPKVPTLAIRIFDSAPPNVSSLKLMNASKYIGILEYTFDDLDLDRIRKIRPEYAERLISEHPIFNSQIAKQLLQDFYTNYKNADELLVHCTMGACRSPAVAIALNEMFKLGEDTEKMKNSYPYNKHVYRLLIESDWQEINLVS